MANNLAGTAITAAAATTTQTSSDINTLGCGNGVFVLDMTTVGTGSVTLTIKGKDVASGKYYTILAGAAVTTNSTNVYKVGRGLTASANAVANDVLPPIIQLVATANNANATTYTVGYNLAP